MAVRQPAEITHYADHRTESRCRHDVGEEKSEREKRAKCTQVWKQGKKSKRRTGDQEMRNKEMDNGSGQDIVKLAG